MVKIIRGGYKLKKIWFMLASVVVLNLYLNFNHITRIFSDKILGVQVLSAEEIDSLCDRLSES